MNKKNLKNICEYNIHEYICISKFIYHLNESDFYGAE
jgi:hypothetical protein